MSHPLISWRMSVSPGLCMHCSRNTEVIMVMHVMVIHAMVRTHLLSLHSYSGATLWAIHKSFLRPTSALPHVSWTILASEATSTHSLTVPHWLNLLRSTQFPSKFHVATVSVTSCSLKQQWSWASPFSPRAVLRLCRASTTDGLALQALTSEPY